MTFLPAGGMDICKRLGLNIRRLRKDKGLSQEEFAFEADETQRTYVSEVERGKRNPTITKVAQFARVLGVTPGHLLDADPNRTTKAQSAGRPGSRA
ncbi:MAG: helix-turn-helix transcriptional regulator [Rhodospirillaceae bacterium]|nr:helix-turn-helix transcriptional regulator [Rhodospirillaceae bacterium]